MKDERFKPKMDSNYWRVVFNSEAPSNSILLKCIWRNSYTDRECYRYGNCHRLQCEASVKLNILKSALRTNIEAV